MISFPETDSGPDPAPMVINGRRYTLWSQFIHRKHEWIGGTLQDLGDGDLLDPNPYPASTTITDIELRPNGEESAFFEVKGKDFSCGFDVKIGGVQGDSEASKQGWLTFYASGGHRWRIKRN